MSYENIICVHCQDSIMLGEGHTKVVTKGGTYHAHIMCHEQRKDYKLEQDEEYQLQQKHEKRLIKQL